MTRDQGYEASPTTTHPARNPFVLHSRSGSPMNRMEISVMPAPLWRILIGSLGGAMVAIAVFLLAAFVVGSWAQGALTARGVLDTSMVAFVVAVPILWPIVLISGVGLLVLVAARNHSVPVTWFVLAGLLEGATVVTFLWNRFWGLHVRFDAGLIVLGGAAGAAAAAVFALAVRTPETSHGVRTLNSGRRSKTPGAG